MSHPLTLKAPLEPTQASTISLQDLSTAQEPAPQSVDHHPPISILPPDILYHIFDFCTLMHPYSDYNTPALSRLQDLSLVCTHWSTLLLAAPALWSRALNLTYMRRMLLPPDRAETIRRAGQAPMTVQVGKVLAADAPFVFEFLERYWRQIEGLHILNRYGNVRPRDAQKWCDLALKASDRLCHLSVHSSPGITASFLTSVALNRFPCLESLDIFRKEQGIRDKGCVVETEDVGSVSQFASLPRLRRIAFASEYMLPRDLDGILKFLHGITPAAGCRLSFKSRFPFQYAPPSTVERLLAVFERYYVTVGGTPGTSVRVCSSSSSESSLEPTAFVFLKRELRIFVPIELGSAPVAFHLRESDSDIPPMHQPSLIHQMLIPAMLSHLQTYPLPTIEVLRLGIEHPRFFDPAIHTALDALVLKLTSVRELRTDGTTLRHLAALQSQSQLSSSPTLQLRVVFPALRVLHLDPSGVPDSMPSLRRLVVARRDMGVPVDSLTLALLMYVEDMDMKVDMVRSELEGLTGLTVVICKYSLYGHFACGSMEVVIP